MPTPDIVLVRVDRVRATNSQHPRHIHPPLDLFYIRSAIAQHTDYSTALIDNWLTGSTDESLIEQVLRLKPKLVVIRAMSWCIEEACQLAQGLRKSGLVTVAVGEQVTHRALNRVPSSFWDESWDFTLLGEPEEITPKLIIQLLNSGATTQIREELTQRLRENRPYQVQSPDLLDFPAFSQFELNAYPFPFPVPGPIIKKWGYIITAWGCPYQCKHCTEVVRKSVGTNLRPRDPKRVVDEMETLIKQGAQGIAFEDDTLFCNRKHFLALCAEIKRRSLTISWIANARPDELDVERVAAAADAGAVLLKIGIESGSAELIRVIGKSSSGEKWLQQVHEGVKSLKQHGIASVGLFMAGMPGESEQQLRETIDLATTLNTEYIQVQRFTAYPDVALAKENGYIASSHKNLYHYGQQNQTVSAIPLEQLEKLQQDFYKIFYLRPGFLASHIKLFWRWYLSPVFFKSIPAKLSFILARDGQSKARSVN